MNNELLCPVCKSNNITQKVEHIWCSTYKIIGFTCQNCGAKFTHTQIESRKNHYILFPDLKKFYPKINFSSSDWTWNGIKKIY